MATPCTLHLLAAGALLACGPRSATTTADAGDGSTAAGASSTAVGTTTTTGVTLPTTTGAATTTTGDTTTSADTTSTDGCLGDADCAPQQCVASADERCRSCVPTTLECADDFVCGPGSVCIEFPQTCPCDSPFTTICTPGCDTTADCESGGVCDPETQYCVYDPCVADEDCAPLFDCVPVQNGDACRRRRCESAADCEGAFCIDGLCHAAPGTCTPEF